MRSLRNGHDSDHDDPGCRQPTGEKTLRKGPFIYREFVFPPLFISCLNCHLYGPSTIRSCRCVHGGIVICTAQTQSGHAGVSMGE